MAIATKRPKTPQEMADEEASVMYRRPAMNPSIPISGGVADRAAKFLMTTDWGPAGGPAPAAQPVMSPGMATSGGVADRAGRAAVDWLHGNVPGIVGRLYGGGVGVAPAQPAPLPAPAGDHYRISDSGASVMPPKIKAPAIGTALPDERNIAEKITNAAPGLIADVAGRVYGGGIGVGSNAVSPAAAADMLATTGAAAPAASAGAGFGRMGEVRMAEREGLNAAPAAAPNNDAAITERLRQRSATLLRDMLLPGVTPEMHAAMASERRQVEDALRGVRRGNAPMTAPAAIDPDQAAINRARLFEGENFQGPASPLEPGMVDRMNASNAGRFSREQAARAGGRENALKFANNYFGTADEQDAARLAALKATTAGAQAAQAQANAVVAAGGQTPDEALNAAKAKAQIDAMAREEAARANAGGISTEDAQAKAQRRQNALNSFGINEGWYNNINTATGAINSGMAIANPGEVAGTWYGGADSMVKGAETINAQIDALDRLAAVDPEQASEIAGSLLIGLPVPDASGGYHHQPGIFSAGNNRNRATVASGLNRARQRLLRLKGQ